jgi:hypothetical protein
MVYTVGSLGKLNASHKSRLENDGPGDLHKVSQNLGTKVVLYNIGPSLEGFIEPEGYGPIHSSFVSSLCMGAPSNNII